MLQKFTNNLNKVFSQYKLYNNKKLIESLSVYYPDSQNHYVYPKNTFSSANNSIIILSEIIEANNTIPVTPVEDFFAGSRSAADQKLKDLFNKYGSDKSSYHNYDLAYCSVLNMLLQQNRPLKVFEIGLGTNNVSVPSNMGVHGKPGASLRAFRDYLPGALIFGADIDKRVLFTEERIQTTYLDQTNYDTYDDLAKQFKVSLYDLIIDDGLHSPEANLNTLKFALKNLDPRGWLIIEDIPLRSLPVWKTTKALLDHDFNTWIVNCKGFYLFVMTSK